MADDDELVFVGVTRTKKQRRRTKQAKRRQRQNFKASLQDMPDSSFNASKSQQECWIIDEPKTANEDPTDLIVLDSVESEEGEIVESKRSTPNGHINSIINEDISVDTLLEKIKFLEQENHFLKFGRSKDNEIVTINSPSDGPLIQVTFFDAALAQKYRAEVQKFLLELSSKEKALNTERRHEEKTGDEPGCSFVVDKGTSEQCINLPDEWAVPVYNTDFGDALQVSSEREPVARKESLVVEKCFNCNGCHLIKDCPEKHDQRRIMQNKRKLYSQRTPTNNKNRLGNEKLWQLKYTPGNISDALRTALNIKPIQVPLYIYNMRVLGYPPGWLKEAQVDRSGINIYDSDGNIVGNDDKEEGEIEEIKVEHDPSKLIDFPGFNVTLPSSCIDEHLKLGLPAMKLHQQRVEVEKFMKPVQSRPYVRKKIALHAAKKQKVSSEQADTIDMDIDEITDLTTPSSDENSQKEIIFASPVRVHTDEDSADQSQGTSSQESSRVSSPSLIGIEEKKDDLTLDPEAESSGESGTEKATHDCTSLEEVEIVLSTPVRGSKRELDGYMSKSVIQGTPVLGQHSPFHKLPEADVFSKGISDHINYENLPNATGCYDKLRGVLNKVRKKTKDLLD